MNIFLTNAFLLCTAILGACQLTLIICNICCLGYICLSQYWVSLRLSLKLAKVFYPISKCQVIHLLFNPGISKKRSCQRLLVTCILISSCVVSQLPVNQSLLNYVTLSSSSYINVLYSLQYKFNYFRLPSQRRNSVFPLLTFFSISFYV